MQKLIDFLLRQDPNVLGKLLGGVVGPHLRVMTAQYPFVKVDAIGRVVSNAGKLIAGETVVYASIGDYTLADIQAMSESVAALAFPLFEEYTPEIEVFVPGLNVSESQLATLMVAVGDHVATAI